MQFKMNSSIEARSKCMSLLIQNVYLSSLQYSAKLKRLIESLSGIASLKIKTFLLLYLRLDTDTDTAPYLVFIHIF